MKHSLTELIDRLVAAIEAASPEEVEQAGASDRILSAVSAKRLQAGEVARIGRYRFVKHTGGAD
jgi:hypothetical protein